MMLRHESQQRQDLHAGPALRMIIASAHCSADLQMREYLIEAGLDMQVGLAVIGS